jgi:hypothetical protein
MARTARSLVTENDLDEVREVAIAIRVPVPESDEERALALLAQLPKYCQDTIREMAYVHLRRPVWTCLLGYALRAYEDGTLSNPLSDPSWPRTYEGLPDILIEAECEFCHERFKPTRYKQRFCKNQCGTDAERAAKGA